MKNSSSVTGCNTCNTLLQCYKNTYFNDKSNFCNKLQGVTDCNTLLHLVTFVTFVTSVTSVTSVTGVTKLYSMKKPNSYNNLKDF
jgi:hypothetical protein